MLIKADRLFDGVGEQVVRDAVVDVQQGRIVDVGSAAGSTPGPDGIEDLGDVTLLPGLIDAHQHLVFDASNDPVGHLRDTDDQGVLQSMRAVAQRALAVGITTIRDLGDRNYLAVTLRELFRDGAEVGPRILAAGPPLTVSGGHCWFLGGVADGTGGIRSAIRERAARGVDVIKIMATGGNMTPSIGPDQSQYSRAELCAAVAEAHARGLPIAAHAHGSQGIADALAAGVDSIEHCTFFTAEGVDSNPDLLAALARSGVALGMTGAMLPSGGTIYPAMQHRLAAMLANWTTLARAGARIVGSSDAGVSPNKPHDVLPYGVAALPRIGLTNVQALRAVTAVAAQMCGIAGTTGTIAPGLAADLMAVRGNPLEDISAIHDVAAVFVGGRRVPVGPSGTTG